MNIKLLSPLLSFRIFFPPTFRVYYHLLRDEETKQFHIQPPLSFFFWGLVVLCSLYCSRINVPFWVRSWGIGGERDMPKIILTMLGNYKLLSKSWNLILKSHLSYLSLFSDLQVHCLLDKWPTNILHTCKKLFTIAYSPIRTREIKQEKKIWNKTFYHFPPKI